MKFIVAIGIVSTMASFKISFEGAPLTHNYFVIGHRQQQNSTHLLKQIGNNHNRKVVNTVNGATNTSTKVNNDFPSNMSDGVGWSKVPPPWKGQER
jgi:hypothetical protein